jgi:hypothetical protein
VKWGKWEEGRPLLDPGIDPHSFQILIESFKKLKESKLSLKYSIKNGHLSVTILTVCFRPFLLSPHVSEVPGLHQDINFFTHAREVYPEIYLKKIRMFAR